LVPPKKKTKSAQKERRNVSPTVRAVESMDKDVRNLGGSVDRGFTNLRRDVRGLYGVRSQPVVVNPRINVPAPTVIIQPAPQNVNGQITRRDLFKYGIFTVIALASTAVGAYVLGGGRRDGDVNVNVAVNGKNTPFPIQLPQASSVAPNIINGVYGKRGSSAGQLYLDLQNGTSNADVYLDPDGVEGGVNQSNGIAYEIKLRADNGQIEFRKKLPPNYNQIILLSSQQFLREIDPNGDLDVLRLYDNRTNRLIRMVGK